MQSQIVAYFTLCVWLLPLQLILGLVAGENMLPTLTGAVISLKTTLDTNYIIDTNYIRYELSR